MRHGAQASAYWIKRVVADLGWDTVRSALFFYNKVIAQQPTKSRAKTDI